MGTPKITYKKKLIEIGLTRRLSIIYHPI